jgi:MFS family permease
MSAVAVAAPGVAMPAVPAVRPPVNKWLVTLSVTFGTLMGAIDSSIVNVAIPHIRGAVGASTEEITWISTGFVVATVLVMPLTGFLGRLFGQKRVYMFCLALFVVGSMLCGVARSLWGLVIFRAIQGLGAGALQPTEQAILRTTFPVKEQGMAMAVFAMAVMIGPAVGPSLGGYIVDHYSWPWIFYINVPVGALGLYMVFNFVHEPEDIRQANREMAESQRKHMDWWGIGLLSIGLSSLQYLLEEGARDDWFQSRLITGCALVAGFGLVAFVIRELTAPVPAVNLALFKDKVFLSGTLIGSVMFAMLMSLTFLLPLFMQDLLGFTALQSGARPDASDPGDDRGDAIRWEDLQPGVTPADRGPRRHPLRHRRLADEPLHAGDNLRGGGELFDDPGNRLQLPVRAADDRGLGIDSPSENDGCHRPQLAPSPDRRVGGAGDLRDVVGQLRDGGPGEPVGPHQFAAARGAGSHGRNPGRPGLPGLRRTHRRDHVPPGDGLHRHPAEHGSLV